MQCFGQAAQIRETGLEAHHKYGISLRRMAADDFGNNRLMESSDFRQIRAVFAAVADGNFHQFALMVCNGGVFPHILQFIGKRRQIGIETGEHGQIVHADHHFLNPVVLPERSGKRPQLLLFAQFGRRIQSADQSGFADWCDLYSHLLFILVMF